MYLHTLLNRHEKESTRKINLVVKDVPNKKKGNLEEKSIKIYQISVEQEEEKVAFKDLVKRKCVDVAFKQLEDIKE